MQKGRPTILPLLFIIFVLSACGKFYKVKKSDSIDRKYKAAVNYYKEEEFYKAGVLFEEIVPLMSGQKQSEDAQYYYAWCHFKQEQFSLSAHYFKRFYATFTRSEHVEECMFMHALSLYKNAPPYNLDQTDTYKALEASRKFMNRYPQSKYKDSCRSIIKEMEQKLEKKAFYNASLYHKIGQYKAAVESLGNFRQNYPVSRYDEHAAFLRLEAQYDLASLSVSSKKTERYRKAIEFYQAFVDEYPNSQYLKQAEKIYETSKENLQSLKS